MPYGISGPYLDYYGKRIAPEQDGWRKELVVRGIFGKDKFFKPVKGRKTLSSMKTETAYVYREYKVKVGTCSKCAEALELGKISDPCDRIKLMSLSTGLYHRCYLGVYGVHGNADFTQQYMNWDSKNWRLLKEEPLTHDEVIERYLKGEIDYIFDFGIIHEIENLTGRIF